MPLAYYSPAFSVLQQNKYIHQTQHEPLPKGNKDLSQPSLLPKIPSPLTLDITMKGLQAVQIYTGMMLNMIIYTQFQAFYHVNICTVLIHKDYNFCSVSL